MNKPIDEMIAGVIDAVFKAHIKNHGLITDPDGLKDKLCGSIIVAIVKGEPVSRQLIIDALVEAYNAGVWCAKECNHSERKWTPAKTKKERSQLNRIMKRFGCGPLVDEEYQPFMM